MNAYEHTTTLRKLAQLLDEAGYLSEQSRTLLDAGADASGGASSDPSDTPIHGASCDSREVGAGNIFCCKGLAFEPRYLTMALEAGAVAYLCEEGLVEALAAEAPDVPSIVTTNVRKAMPIVSREAWGRPDETMPIVGITGTKGKTTSSYMLRDIIDAGERHSKAAIIGSVEKYDGVELFESRRTTPEAPELWRHLSNARDTGLTMVMEVSSQGLKYDRMDGVNCSICCFLNISEDHISEKEHPDYEDYLTSKLLIFRHAKHAVVNLNTQFLDRVLEAASVCEDVTTVSTQHEDADVFATDIHSEDGLIAFTCHTPEWTAPVKLGVGGAFNVENALVAIACARLLGIGQEQIVTSLANTRVEGRMESYRDSTGRLMGMVDFAHNGVSFDSILSTLKTENPGRAIIVVFGATGNKGYPRRKGMAEAAGRWADYVVLTEDDPDREDPRDICKVLEGFLPEGFPHEIDVDRPHAVRRAMEVADELMAAAQERYEADGAIVNGYAGAIVAVLGKGTEDSMWRNGHDEYTGTDAEFVIRELAAREERLKETR
ncbi:MAG: UDP-N-acetylmuramyl-tripeptide synthetase [Atopobiaceae bacterium]|nr:UDP-N-acetylmuramyl-tripeptide synthetase [Atopobiaceae bacterium]